MRLALRGCLRPLCYYRQSHLRKKTSHKCSSHLQDVSTISYYCCYCLRNKSKFAIHLLSQRFEHEYDPVQLNEAV